MKSTEEKQVMDALDRVVDKVLAYSPKKRRERKKVVEKVKKER